jgi:hypothetical protein
MFLEVQKLQDSNILNEFHAKWQTYEDTAKEQSQSRCPMCEQLNGYMVPPGKWKISCGKCGHKFSVDIKPSNESKYQTQKNYCFFFIFFFNNF